MHSVIRTTTLRHLRRRPPPFDEGFVFFCFFFVFHLFALGTARVGKYIFYGPAPRDRCVNTRVLREHANAATVDRHVSVCGHASHTAGHVLLLCTPSSSSGGHRDEQVTCVTYAPRGPANPLAVTARPKRRPHK